MVVVLNYLVNPFKQLNGSLKRLSLWHSLFSLVVFTLFLISLGNRYTIFSFLVQFLLVVVVLSLVVGIIDFIAQLLKKKSAAVLLFKWLAVSTMLWIYITPLMLLASHVSVVWLLLLYVVFFSIYFKVQVLTIKKLYGIRTVQAFILLSLPGVLLGGGILLFGLNLITYF